MRDIIPKSTLAFVWSSFGPYHVARCAAVAALAAPDISVLGIELGPRTVTYQWLRPRGRVRFDRAILTEEAAELVSPRQAFLGLRRVLRGRPCKAVFLPSYWPAPNLALLAAAKSLGIATVMMNDSHGGTAQPGRLRHLAKKYIVSKFDAALVGGTKQRRYFDELGLADRKIFLGYDAIDNPHFERASDEVRESSDSWRQTLGLPSRYLLSLGRLVPKKNSDVIIEAFAKYRQLSPDGVALVFVGSGVREQALEDKARAYGLKVVDRRAEVVSKDHGDVYFYGFKQIDQSPAFYALADAFILASTHEEWGLVVNEAMACATPVIVSSAAGCADDLVVVGKTGWTFDPRSACNLTEVLQSTLADAPKLREVGAGARAHVRNWDCNNFARNALLAAATRFPALIGLQLYRCWLMSRGS